MGITIIHKLGSHPYPTNKSYLRMKSLKMKSILFLALAGYIEAGPCFNDTIKDVNPTPDVDSAAEDSPTGETIEMITSRTRRSIKKCKKKCKGSKKKKRKCKRKCKKDNCDSNENVS